MRDQGDPSSMPTSTEKCWRHDYEHREYICRCDPPVAGDTGHDEPADHGDDERYIFTARDYWTGLKVAVDSDAGEHVRTLFAHRPYGDHCGGYEVHAWPCFPASVMLADLREATGHEEWSRIDPFGSSS